MPVPLVLLLMPFATPKTLLNRKMSSKLLPTLTQVLCWKIVLWKKGLEPKPYLEQCK